MLVACGAKVFDRIFHMWKKLVNMLPNSEKVSHECSAVCSDFGFVTIGCNLCVIYTLPVFVAQCGAKLESFSKIRGTRLIFRL